MVATTVADPSNSLNNDFDRMDVDQNGVRDVEQEESIKGIIYPPPEVRSILFQSLCYCMHFERINIGFLFL
jgi:hypothetical protein